MNISLIDFNAFVLVGPGVVVALLAVVALVCGRRSRTWWLAAGLAALVAVLVTQDFALRPLLSPGGRWRFTTVWLTVTVLGAIAAPLMLARHRLGSRPILAIGVLLGGLLGALIGDFVVMGLTCASATDCYLLR
jgi:hypothetical protein